MNDESKNPPDESKQSQQRTLQGFAALLLVLGVIWSGVFLCVSLLVLGQSMRLQPNTAKIGLWTMLLAVAFMLAFAGYRVGGDLANRDNARSADAVAPLH